MTVYLDQYHFNNMDLVLRKNILWLLKYGQTFSKTR